jgi:hypothetical protein
MPNEIPREGNRSHSMRGPVLPPQYLLTTQARKEAVAISTIGRRSHLCGVQWSDIETTICGLSTQEIRGQSLREGLTFDANEWLGKEAIDSVESELLSVE